ncbi:LexA family protein [Flavobacterium pallidum]|uniref:Peptidase S24 n=1 Tax=Flavobacterium pallidum TaxID=2172098 RepID=A0A2S1SFZ6_9FLAO|nr:translesion error-prone DNA polymerase V autoproteolytic subunit [Flavobacterium pallidum]AWI25334.1 peptidase S24 [Flavobacterium pallidum]
MSLEKPQKPLEFFIPSTSDKQELPFSETGISAGFPSPAMDFMEAKVDMNDILVKNPKTTFYARVSGNSMINAGIADQDILVIDKSIMPADNHIAVCFIDGDFTVKRIKLKKEGVFLMPENDSYPEIQVKEEQQFVIWGVVTYVVKKL